MVYSMHYNIPTVARAVQDITASGIRTDVQLMRFRNGQIDGVLHSLTTGYQRSDAYRFHFTNVSEWEDVVALSHQAVEVVDEPICGANLEDVL